MTTALPTITDYMAFLRAKMPRAEVAGFEPVTPCSPSMFPHQRDVSAWAVRGGRRAVFANFGLGKTRMHLQIAKWVHELTGGRYLFVAPLGVRHVFTEEDGPEMGMCVQYVRDDAEVRAAKSPYLVTNYERVRDGDISLEQFAGAGLDEASVLRSFGSLTYQTYLEVFKVVRYRFVFTATPSPNSYKELIHYAAFLGVMDSGEALTRFFQRNSEEAGDLTLYPHMEQQFWYWLSTWACFITKPSDLGYSDEGYDLPKLHVHWHCVDVDHRKAWKQTDSWGQMQLIQQQKTGLKGAAEIKRETILARLAKAGEIIKGGPAERHWLLWHDLEDERRAIEKALPEARTVYGTQKLELREELILGFSRGQYRILATKPIIAGSGCNFQKHCSHAVFLGAGYKFNDFIQAVHRLWRFLQKEEVHVHIIHSEAEAEIMQELKDKWRAHDALMERMSELLRNNKLTNLEV